MNYKIKGAIKRSKWYFVIYGIVWLAIATMLSPALTYSYAILTRIHTSQSTAYAFSELYRTIINPIEGFNCVFKFNIFGEYIGTLLVLTLIFTVFFIIGFLRASPKNEYTDIEHGSSDWSKKGEQYRILNKNKGILLAQDNYLPVDKRGNVNVLVVGRFRFW